MSDLPPAEQPQAPRARRVARPKPRAAAARRANRSLTSPTNTESAAEPLPPQTEKLTTKNTPQTDETNEQTITAHPELVANETAKEPFTVQVLGFTIFSKPILLWAGIAGVANFLFSIATLLIFLRFASTKADAESNAGLLSGVYCLSFLVPPALAFFAGLRATARQGSARIGSMAGLWSIVCLTLLGLIYTVIATAITQQWQTLTGDYWTELAANLLFEGAIGYGAGYFGGWFSERRRKQAEQRQEALTSSS